MFSKPCCQDYNYMNIVVEKCRFCIEIAYSNRDYKVSYSHHVFMAIVSDIISYCNLFHLPCTVAD